MRESPLHELQDVVNLVQKSTNRGESISQLTRAFSLFSEETKRLEQAYIKLQKHFKAVNIQLEESHQQLQEKVMELDVVSHYLNSILRNISQGIVFIGLTGVVTTYNTAAERILGLNHKSVIFQSFWDLFPDCCFGFSMRHALDKLSSPETLFMTYRNKELEITTSFVRKKPKSHQGIILLIRDVTEFRRLQKEASRKDRLQELGEIAASVAHEIRNPLGGIAGYASLLKRDLQGQVKLEGMADQILEGSKRLSHLVEDVLHYARPMKLSKTVVDLSLFLKELKAFVEVDPSFPKQVEIRLNLPEHLEESIIDKENFRAALLNLIYNGLQAMPDKGILTLSLRQNKDKIFLSINDTGIGIDPEHLEKLFTPHFTTKAQGNGFGLCETYKIIEAHQGTIEVISHPGEGTTFFIILPLKG